MCAPGRNGDLHRDARAPDPPRDVCWTVGLSRKSFRSLPFSVVRGPITIRPHVLPRQSFPSSGSSRSSTYGKSRSVVPWFILLTPAGAFVGTVLPVGHRRVMGSLHEPLAFEKLVKTSEIYKISRFLVDFNHNWLCSPDSPSW